MRSKHVKENKTRVQCALVMYTLSWLDTGDIVIERRNVLRRADTSASSLSNIQLQDRDLIYWKAREAESKAKSV